MPLKWRHEQDKLSVFTVSGELGIAELELAQREADSLMGQSAGWKLLVCLQDFAGWKKEAGWGDTLLFQQHDEQLERIAAVGPSEWRDQVEIFMLKGMRSVEIEYLSDEAEVREWLAVS